jgi:hypothetical protein
MWGPLVGGASGLGLLAVVAKWLFRPSPFDRADLIAWHDTAAEVASLTRSTYSSQRQQVDPAHALRSLRPAIEAHLDVCRRLGPLVAQMPWAALVLNSSAGAAREMLQRLQAMAAAPPTDKKEFADDLQRIFASSVIVAEVTAMYVEPRLSGLLNRVRARVAEAVRDGAKRVWLIEHRANHLWTEVVDCPRAMGGWWVQLKFGSFIGTGTIRSYVSP